MLIIIRLLNCSNFKTFTSLVSIVSVYENERITANQLYVPNPVTWQYFTYLTDFEVQFSILKLLTCTFVAHLFEKQNCYEIYICCPVELWKHIVKKVEEINSIHIAEKVWGLICFSYPSHFFLGFWLGANGPGCLRSHLIDSLIPLPPL